MLWAGGSTSLSDSGGVLRRLPAGVSAAVLAPSPALVRAPSAVQIASAKAPPPCPKRAPRTRGARRARRVRGGGSIRASCGGSRKGAALVFTPASDLALARRRRAGATQPAPGTFAGHVRPALELPRAVELRHVAAPRRARECLAAHRVVRNSAQALRERTGIFTREQQAAGVVYDLFRDTVDIRSYDTRAERHGFEHRQRESFGAGREHEHVGGVDAS